MLVVGCVPATVDERIDGQFGLSDAVRNAVDEAVAIIERLIALNRNSIAA
jgi:Ni,Fe-hydrogenase maturation factor